MIKQQLPRVPTVGSGCAPRGSPGSASQGADLRIGPWHEVLASEPRGLEKGPGATGVLEPLRPPLCSREMGCPPPSDDEQLSYATLGLVQPGGRSGSLGSRSPGSQPCFCC